MAGFLTNNLISISSFLEQLLLNQLNLELVFISLRMILEEKISMYQSI